MSGNLPPQCSVPARNFKAFLDTEFSSLPDVESRHRTNVIDGIATAYNRRLQFDPPKSQSNSAKTIDYVPTKPTELVFSVDNPSTTRRDDCLQVFWTGQSNAPQLCVKIHVVNIALKFPVGTQQDKGYRALVCPAYFTTPGLYPIRVPPLPDRSPRDFVTACKNFEADFYFNATDHRAAITAEIYYDFDPVTQQLKRDEKKSTLYYSWVRIRAALEFGDSLNEAMKVLKPFGLKESMNYEALKVALTEARIKEESQYAYIAVHMANLACDAIHTQLPAEIKKFATPQRISRLAINRRGMPSDSPNEQPVTLEAVAKPLGVKLISEFSTFAMSKLLTHKVLDRFIVSTEYSVPEVKTARDALTWATRTEVSPTLPVADLKTYYEAIFGIPPTLTSGCALATAPETALHSRLTHPGRDYTHLLLQRLVCLWLDEQSAGSSDSDAKRTKGDETSQESEVAKKLFGCDTFSACKRSLETINTVLSGTHLLEDIASAINTRMLLVETGKKSPTAELPLSVVVASVQNNSVAVSLPTLSHPRFPTEATIKPIVLPWPSTTTLPLPPIGTTLPALVRFDTKTKSYTARWYYENVLSETAVKQ